MAFTAPEADAAKTVKTAKSAKSAPTVKKGTTAVRCTCKKGKALVRFKAPKTAIYRFTISSFSGKKGRSMRASLTSNGVPGRLYINEAFRQKIAAGKSGLAVNQLIPQVV